MSNDLKKYDRVRILHGSQTFHGQVDSIRKGYSSQYADDRHYTEDRLLISFMHDGQKRFFYRNDFYETEAGLEVLFENALNTI
jgi:hypothetical protein